MFGIHDGDNWLYTTDFGSVKEAARYARGRNLPEDTTRISWKSYHLEWYGLKSASEWLTEDCEPLIFQTVPQANCHLPHFAEFRATPIKQFSISLDEVPHNTQAQAPQVTKFDTGAVRSADREGERYDLISPIAMKRLARTCDEGAKKYGVFNWEKGMPVSDLLNHAISHIYNYLAGDRSEDHLAHAVWNCMSAIHSAEKWPHLNTDLRKPNCELPNNGENKRTTGGGSGSSDT